MPESRARQIAGYIGQNICKRSTRKEFYSLHPFKVAGLILLFVLAIVSVGATAVGLIFLADSQGRTLSFEAALNGVLVCILALVSLPLLHRAAYRWQWHVDHGLKAGKIKFGELPDYSSEPTARPPAVPWTTGQKLLFASIYIVAITTMIVAYAPIGNQTIIQAFIAYFSAGRASYSSLSTLLLVYLPMFLILCVVMLLLDKDQKRYNAGLMSPDEALRFQGKLNWFFSFAIAFATTSFLCFLTGAMINGYLA